ncbi:MAG: hypothetical protein GY810_08690 [Aureispira sp.]|nr:hypothetical protein [Aureispira sp.]
MKKSTAQNIVIIAGAVIMLIPVILRIAELTDDVDSIPVIFSIGGGFMVLGLIWRAVTKEKESAQIIETQYQLLAQKLGLSFLMPQTGHPHPKLDGNIEGFLVLCDIYNKGVGRSYLPYTRFDIQVNNPNLLSFQLYPQNFLGKMGKRLGGQDIEIGNPVFDDQFIVKSNDENFIKNLLSSPICHALAKDWRCNGHIFLEKNTIGFQMPNAIRDDEHRQKFEKMVSLLFMLAKRMKSLET